MNNWDPNNKAVVLDDKNCTWSKECVGLATVTKVGGRMAMFYDSPGDDSLSHKKRNIGLACLDIRLKAASE